MKNNVLLLLLGLFVWIFGGLWLHHKCCCSSSGGVSNIAIPHSYLQIKDGIYFKASAQDNIKFEDQKVTYTMSKDVEAVFAKTATYLNQHPAKVLQIETPQIDLEKQRGETVAAYLVNNNRVTQRQVKVEQTATQQLEYNFNCPKPFATSLGTEQLTCLDNFAFEHSNFELAVPLSKELNDMLENVATYLKKNPNTKLNIIAGYLSAEENKSSATNLGKARANKIRSILLEKYGVSPNQVDYNGSPKNDLTFLPFKNFKKDLLIGPIDFIFTNEENNNNTANANADRIKALEKDLLITPRRLYFDTGKDEILIDDKFRKYFEDVIYYLENVPTASIECSGHTDNQGDEIDNLKLAQERADFTARYFSKQGIPSSKINTVSLGEKEPIESNKTASGRAKNRRVEIIVKQ